MRQNQRAINDFQYVKCEYKFEFDHNTIPINFEIFAAIKSMRFFQVAIGT